MGEIQKCTGTGAFGRILGVVRLDKNIHAGTYAAKTIPTQSEV